MIYTLWLSKTTEEWDCLEDLGSWKSDSLKETYESAPMNLFCPIQWTPFLYAISKWSVVAIPVICSWSESRYPLALPVLSWWMTALQGSCSLHQIKFSFLIKQTSACELVVVFCEHLHKLKFSRAKGKPNQALAESKCALRPHLNILLVFTYLHCWLIRCSKALCVAGLQAFLVQCLLMPCQDETFLKQD